MTFYGRTPVALDRNNAGATGMIAQVLCVKGEGRCSTGEQNVVFIVFNAFSRKVVNFYAAKYIKKDLTRNPQMKVYYFSKFCLLTMLFKGTTTCLAFHEPRNAEIGKCGDYNWY